MVSTVKLWELLPATGDEAIMARKTTPPIGRKKTATSKDGNKAAEKKPSALSPQAKRTIEALNNRLAERESELAIINSVGEAMARQLDMDTITRIVGDKVRDIFQADAASIMFYDEEKQQIEMVYSYDRGYVQLPPPIPMGKGLSSKVILSRQPLVIGTSEEADALDSINIPNAAGEEELAQSWLGVPIIVGDRVIGLISVESYKKHAFDESSVRLLSTLTSNMGVAIQNARLFNETLRLLKETEARNAELAIINSLQAELDSRDNIQSMYDLVGDKVHEIFDAQTTILMVYDKKTNALLFPYIMEKGIHLHQEPLPFPETGGGFSTHVIRTRQPLMVNENFAEESRKYQSVLLGENRDENVVVKSGIWVPLMVEEEARGVISLQNLEREHAFKDSDVRLLTTFANSLSITLENARLFDETQRLLKETEQRASELAIINSVQKSLVTKLDLQAIIDLIGEKIWQIFDAQIALISLFNAKSNTIEHRYIIERGERLYVNHPVPLDKFRQKVVDTRQTWLINENYRQIAQELGEDFATAGEEPKSLLFVPLIVGQDVTGIISLQNIDHERAFNTSDVRLLQTFANGMSVALENARLFDETVRRARETAVLNEVGRDISSTLDLSAVMEKIATHARDLLSASTSAIYLPENNGAIFRAIAAKGKIANQIMADHIRAGEGIIGSLAQQGKAEFVNATNSDPRTVQIPGTQLVTEERLMVTPLLTAQKVIGIMAVWREGGNPFVQADLEFLEELSLQAAIAIKNANFFDETKQRAAELATINTVSNAIAGTLDLNTIIELVGEQVRTTFKADIAYVALLDEKTRTINFQYQYGEEIRSLPLGQGLTSKVIETSQPILINQDIEKRRTELGATMAGKRRARSYLGVPIFIGGATIGVLSVQSVKQEGAFTESDQRLLGTIAANVGVALQNARLFEDAEEARRAAEEANHAKSAFLANMSHELRTPLNAIIGFTRIVRRKSEGALPEKQLDNLDKVLASGEHLLNLINTVLDIAKIEAGRMEVQASNFSIEALGDQCLNTAQPLIKPGVKLEKEYAPGLTLVYSDQDKLKQIMLNLLSNAAKFTQTGQVRLSIHHDHTHLTIAVSDTGIGINQEALDRIFEEFQQADTSTTRKYGGTGLGLSISRNLARLLGGELSAVSQAGHGATFTLTLPIRYGNANASLPDPAAGPAKEAMSAPQADNRPRQLILVIDDDPDAVYLLQESLSQNYEVIGARTGAEGQKKARELHPRAILLDIMLPDKDGWQVLHDLKQDKRTEDIPIVLLTIVDKKALGFRLGASAYLLKPLDPEAVMDALRRVTEQEGRPTRHVLVVDDDPHIPDMLRQLLPEKDFALEAASDGVAGLEAVARRRPDVILLDLMMPRLDGFGFIEQLRQNPATQNLPIIVISAKELTVEESTRLKESAAYVMRKQGFDSDRLLREINKALETNK
jgi:GAF domain-containing protein/CheY-like chemotaxis protein